MLCTSLIANFFACRKGLEQGEAVKREKQILSDTLKEERKKIESVDIYDQMRIYLLHCKTFLGVILSIHHEQLHI